MAFRKKSLYRKFIIKGVKEHDDYAYMTEVLTRRFRHAVDQEAVGADERIGYNEKKTKR